MKTDLELVIEQINNFREKVQAIAKIDTAQNNSEAFYKVLRDLGYSREGSSKGIFYKIIELLEKRISAVYLPTESEWMTFLVQLQHSKLFWRATRTACQS